MQGSTGYIETLFVIFQSRVYSQCKIRLTSKTQLIQLLQPVMLALHTIIPSRQITFQQSSPAPDTALQAYSIELLDWIHLCI